MLVVFAGSPGAAPLKTGFGEKTQAEVLLINLVREVPRSIAIFSGCGWLNETSAICTVFVVGVVEGIDVYGQPTGML